MPTLNRLNIPEGPVYVYFGASAYATTPDVMPADTLAFGGVLTGTWRAVGYTNDDGITTSHEQDRGEVMSAQQRTPVLRPRNNAVDMVTGTLLEVTLENLRDILGRGTITTTPPATGVAGFKQLRLTDSIAPTIAVLIEGIAPPTDGGKPRRIFFPAVEATGTVEVTQNIGEAGANAGVAFEFTRVGGTESEPIYRDVLAAL